VSDSTPESKPNQSYEFLKKPIPANQDGVTCIIIHEKAQTELGRLLNINANVPFNVYTLPNPDSDSGAWETFSQAVLCLGGTHQCKWIQDYFLNTETHMGQRDKNDVSQWMNWKIQQNWYLLDLLVRETLPIVFVYNRYETDAQGNKLYIPMLGFEFLQHSIRNLKNSTKLKWNREKDKSDKREQKRVLKGKTPVATQRPNRKQHEDSKPQRKRD
jgi:hypothetical protein